MVRWCSHNACFVGIAHGGKFVGLVILARGGKIIAKEIRIGNGLSNNEPLSSQEML